MSAITRRDWLKVGGLSLGREDDLGLLAAGGAKVGVTGTRRVDDAFFTL